MPSHEEMMQSTEFAGPPEEWWNEDIDLFSP
jgi:hypothetical protein